ncbi:hypothetical protein [Paraburkholderia tropica]|uniref:hypothetical protein n=1 Tax=Paraburkholderia tropica TaxID=92647 RepID=UPI003D2A0EF8
MTNARTTAQALRFSAALKAVEASVRLGFIDASDDGAADVTMLVTVAGVDHEVRYQRADGVLSIGLADACGLLPLYRSLAAMCDEPAPDDADLRAWYYGAQARPDLVMSPAYNFANVVRQLLDQTADAELVAFDAEREAASHHVVLLHVPAGRFAEFDAIAADHGLGREGALRRLINAALRNPSLLDEREADAGPMAFDGLDVGEPAPPVEPPPNDRDGS